MSEKSDLRCTTPSCVSAIAKYGENYHMVDPVTKPPAFMPDATACCQYCGGYSNGTEWKHQCKKCGTDVEPGKLVGLFVPHLCQPCKTAESDADRQRGNICGLCRKPRCDCTC